MRAGVVNWTCNEEAATEDGYLRRDDKTRWRDPWQPKGSYSNPQEAAVIGYCRIGTTAARRRGEIRSSGMYECGQPSAVAAAGRLGRAAGGLGLTGVGYPPPSAATTRRNPYCAVQLEPRTTISSQDGGSRPMTPRRAILGCRQPQCPGEPGRAATHFLAETSEPGRRGTAASIYGLQPGKRSRAEGPVKSDWDGGGTKTSTRERTRWTGLCSSGVASRLSFRAFPLAA
ncbi:hypothetical protein B0T24DRAFT_640149 [Lasiosphaeria ovina]|uniref:Uncharacterized protein n=1 Tax=Lasiosphaeria ovina TaxID=92902 RepID=A0AAE0JUM8_9PEZI|nr:hypothetical protein B0T24DRAFT_640149 [Lasiosphaeria ovina]